MKLTPYFQDGSPPANNAIEAFLRVRVVDGLNPNGFVRVWLPSGTPLIVQGSDLLQLNAGDPQSVDPGPAVTGRLTAGDLLHAWSSRVHRRSP